MILGISVDNGHTRGVLMDPGGAIRARAESTAGGTAGVVAVARETLAASRNGQPSTVGISFPDPDAKNWPGDLSFLSTQSEAPFPFAR